VLLCVGVDSDQFQRLKFSDFVIDLRLIELSSCWLFWFAVKDWAKTPLDHVDPYHLGIRAKPRHLLIYICCSWYHVDLEFGAAGYS
jgi:hypothetical protein